MSEVKAIEFFTEVELSWKDFSSLSDDQKSALSIVCFAVSEINSLMRIYAFSDHTLTGKAAIDYSILVQSHGILRSWSAKLFEFSEFVTFRDRKNRTSDDRLLELSRTAKESFNALKRENGYVIARSLRHETTNHYLLDPVRKSLPFVSDRANCNFYLHKKNGNSVFPMGDEVVFIGRINREGAKIESALEKAEMYDQWWKWNLAATKWLHRVHFDFYKEFVEPRSKGKRIKTRDYWIDPRLVGVPDETKLPVFLRVPS